MAKVGLNAGGNAQGTTRRMIAGAAAFLTYELYKDAGRTNVWGNTTDTASISLRRRTETRAPSPSTDAWLPAQDATVGTYTDTVVATVNF